MSSPKLLWRILDLLKSQALPKPLRSTSATDLHKAGPHSTENIVTCVCCGHILSCPDAATRFHCLQCRTTTVIGPALESTTLPPLLYEGVKAQVDRCLLGLPATNSHDLHERLRPLSEYLLAAFGSMACLNASFRIRKRSRRAHYSTSNTDIPAIRRTWDLLALLPSKRPLFCALTGARNCLRRLPSAITDDPKNSYFLLVFLEAPFYSRALSHSDRKPNMPPLSMQEVPEIQALSYDILRRLLGVLSQTERTSAGNYFALWFSQLSTEEFTAKITLINLYITFHLKKHFLFANNPELARRGSAGAGPRPEEEAMQEANGIRRSRSLAQEEFFQYSYLKDEVEELASLNQWPVIPSSRKSKKILNSKIRIHQYSGNYHLKTAAGALGLFLKANFIRGSNVKLPVHAFYNSLVDYVNIKLDFDLWQSRKKTPSSITDDMPALQTVIDYVHGNSAFLDVLPHGSSFYFCQYPFLISLGGKIAVLEYEARRQMERKAEEAFINSLNRRVALDVYFKVKIRRDHIAQDSLRCIQLNPGNLKKSLRVEFINEPGVDAGGLKKEWFLLLTRTLFSPNAGMVYELEDSHYLWFNMVPMENFEMYYLFGAVLGLAIYNSTILDLKFPLAMYKILLGVPVGLGDYQEMNPVAAINLFKLRGYTESELDALELTFEITFSDPFGRVHHRELTKGGANIVVTTENREQFIDAYAQFFLVEGMSKQITAYKAGFLSVVDGNAFSLFSPEEIQLMLCGSDENKFDPDILRSVTHYSGWPTNDSAKESPVVVWLWEYLSGLSNVQRKKFLLFVTGSDRVPATGIQNLSLKITRIGGDSERLPTAHTCFNQLALYEYSSRDKLQDKLTKAVNMLAGFGIK